MSDAKEARRTAKMLARISKEMAARPNLVKAGKGAIAVADLFAPVPGGKARTVVRTGKLLKKVKDAAVLRNTMQVSTPALRKAYQEMMKANLINQGQKAALGGMGIGAAAKTVYDKVQSKRKKK
jgi:hypothetical protein